MLAAAVRLGLTQLTSHLVPATGKGAAVARSQPVPDPKRIDQQRHPPQVHESDTTAETSRTRSPTQPRQPLNHRRGRTNHRV